MCLISHDILAPNPVCRNMGVAAIFIELSKLFVTEGAYCAVMILLLGCYPFLPATMDGFNVLQLTYLTKHIY